MPSPAPPATEERADRDDLARYVPAELLRRIRSARVRGAMRGERRTVTMLFADIQGSTAAAETMDPEDWAEIINGAFEHLIAPIYRYEGTLARLQGDAILAFFGAPIAHEDDPVRAVRAGLDIVAAIEDYAQDVLTRRGVPVAVRVGVNTGLVVVGEVGSDLRVEYTALGDAINVAARMEQTAEPGTVRVTEDTGALLHGMFELADIGPVEVKGKAEPVLAFQVLRPTSEAEHRPPTTPLVGRSAQYTQLESCVTTLLDGIGRICALVGEAGMGKTRLLAELRSHLGERAVVAGHAGVDAADVSWLEGGSRSFETAVPYATFADVLRRWWNLDDAAATPWQRIADAVAAVGDTDTDRAALLATVVGAALPAEQQRLIAALETPVLHQRVTDAVIAYLQAEAERRPLVLVLDDLHWGDSLSLALVERLMNATETAAISLVMAMRPYRDDASWRLFETAVRDYGHRSTTVELTPMSADATGQLLGALMGSAELPADVRTRILDRADGNPLFVEQLVDSWSTSQDAAAGPADRVIDVPTSLAGLLTARLDQLDDSARSVAQVASVVGSEFELAAIAAMSDDVGDLPAAMSSLLRHGIVVERRRRPVPQYAFRHALMQDAAYSTTLLRTRRVLHERLALFLESTQPDAAQDIARHFVAAEAPERAFPYLIQAGEHATRSMALSDAIELFSAAIDALPKDADSAYVVRAHEGLGEAYSLIPNMPEATSAYQRLRDYGRSSATPSVEVAALNRLGIATATGTGDFPRAEQFLTEARTIAERCGDDEGLATYHMNACLVAALQGNLERAIEHDAETARLGASQGSQRIRFAGLMRGALNLLATGQFQEGEVALAEAIEAADEIGATDQGTALRSIGGSELALRDGDLARARQVLSDGREILDRYGSFYSPTVHCRLADIDLATGDIEGALASSAQARRLATEQGQPFVIGAAAACMAHAYALCGMNDLRDKFREEALATLGPPMGDFLASTLWRLLAYASLESGALDLAAEDFAVALTVSSTTRYWERPALLLGLVLTTHDSAGIPQARGRIEEVTAFTDERGIRGYDADIAHATGWLADLEGDTDAADVAFARAAAIAQGQGRRLLQRSAAAGLHRVARARGQDNVAGRWADEVTALTSSMAATIADENLRAAFAQHSRRLTAAAREPDVSGQPT